MRALREWVTVKVPQALSAWLLRAYRRPLGFLIGLVLLPLATVFLVTQLVSVSLWRQQSLRNLETTARLAAEIIDETLQETLRFEQLLAARPGFSRAVRHRDDGLLSDWLHDALPFIPRADLILVLDPAGEVIAAAPREDLVGTSLAASEPFRGVLAQAGRPYISTVYLREGSDLEKVVGVVLPIVDEDSTVVGFLQCQHRIEAVKAWLQKIRVEPEGFLFVADHRQQLVVYPFQVLPGKPKVVSDWPPVAHPLTPGGSTLVFRDTRSGQGWLAGISSVRVAGWRVVAVQPERAALRVLWRVLWLMGLLVGLLAFLLVLISLRWAQLQAFTLRLLRQNTKLLKETQQRRTFEQGFGKSTGEKP